jgi:hypothetical protein
VQPFLVAAFNRIRQTVGNGSCWIVVEEPGRLTLALLQRGAWVAIRSRPQRRALAHGAARDPRAREAPSSGSTSRARASSSARQGEFDPEMHDAWRAQSLSYRDLALAWD